MKHVIGILVLLGNVTGNNVYAYYAQGCEDPAYHQYIEKRLADIEARDQRRLGSTLRDYTLSASANDNPYKIIADLSRHIKYSAQFEPIATVKLKIARVFEYADTLSTSQQIAGDVYDGFSSETHNVGIARAWIAYRQGDLTKAFEALLAAIDIKASPLLSAFGPDLSLIRQLYKDGHVTPVVTYIKKTQQFWQGKQPEKLRRAWLAMIEAECKIQFDSIDTVKANALGLPVADVSRAPGKSDF
ncbi:hypothetical protein DRW07_13970 [Alteromonas sediminis]|uniref:Uncharacterized protein n=2 Tax=Alteromonas sediminis TaxID=2259342 RepID=A0A3N5YLN4_9ALTE|nr:hypothetical protein DRW07_13970 [Alteromonas sediminis]